MNKGLRQPSGVMDSNHYVAIFFRTHFSSRTEPIFYKILLLFCDNKYMHSGDIQKSKLVNTLGWWNWFTVIFIQSSLDNISVI